MSAKGRLLTAGIDVGSSAVKAAIVECDPDGRGGYVVRSAETQRIRRRDPRDVIADTYQAALERAGVASDAIGYVATTGEGELVEFRRGHFYGMTAHARGALFLEPEATAVLDVGALHARAIRIDARSKVLEYRMTSQCASGSGQFLENIARYLGVALDEVGPLSRTADAPETVSSICAVLAETDVINMVSRGIKTANILGGIHRSMAGRFVKLLAAARTSGVVLVTGGLARDEGLVAATREEVKLQRLSIDVRTHPSSIFAGALGAAVWGAYRHGVLERRRAGATASPAPTA
jgi:benzoyl-CoA reductase subunit D